VKDCQYCVKPVVHRGAFLEHCLLDVHVRNIPDCPGTNETEPLQAVTAELETLCNLIMAAEPSNKGACTFVDLDSAVGIPVMPTLSGWLLQYPVVYLAHRATAEILAQLLSDAVLVLHEVQIDGPFFEVRACCIQDAVNVTWPKCVL